MSHDMMNAGKRQIAGKGHRLGRGHADQQRADQSRPFRHADQIDVIQRQAGFCQRLIEHIIYIFQMMSGRDLRHYAAVVFEDLDLRRDHVRQHLPAVGDYCHRRLIAA